MSHPRATALAVILAFFVTASAAIGWAVRHPPEPVAGTDAAQYLDLAARISSGQGLALDSDEYSPTLYREPGFPILLALLRQDTATTLLLVQAALLATAAATVVLLATWAGLPPLAAGAAGILAGSSPSLLDLARQPLSEPLWIALLMLAFATFVRGVQTDRPILFGISGLLFGTASLVRAPIFAIGVGLFTVWALTTWLRGRRQVRALLLRGGIGALLTVLVLAPWIGRNWWQLDTLAMTSRSGVGLVRRAQRALYPADAQWRWARAAVWVAFNPLSARLVPEERFRYGPVYWQSELWDFHTNEARYIGDRADRVCRLADLDSCERSMAIDIALHHPLTYLLNTPMEWVKMNFYPLPSAVALDRNARVWAALLGIAFLAARRQLRGPVAWAALLVALYSLLHLPFDLQERYGAPLLPAYALLATAALTQLLTLLPHSLRLRRPKPTPTTSPTPSPST